jgi:hypothetical protein
MSFPRLTTISFPGHEIKQDPVVFAGVKRSQLNRITPKLEDHLLKSVVDLVKAHGGNHLHLSKAESELRWLLFGAMNKGPEIEVALGPFIEAAGWARVLP